jgi:hypothetical protein
VATVAEEHEGHGCRGRKKGMEGMGAMGEQGRRAYSRIFMYGDSGWLSDCLIIRAGLGASSKSVPLHSSPRSRESSRPCT